VSPSSRRSGRLDAGPDAASGAVATQGRLTAAQVRAFVVAQSRQRSRFVKRAALAWQLPDPADHGELVA